uniref:C-type lectin domain-containing protein n=1 Tax=Globodera rostochiensis TaxID=31243 RepID=A0A914I4V0_GLORO
MRLLLLIVLSLAIVLLSSAHEEPPKPCPEGYSLYNKYCYKAFTNPDKVVKYSEAEKQCKSEGAELASVHNELEREYVNVLVLNEAKKMEFHCKKPGRAFFWFGMKLEWDGKKLKNASWTDGTQMDYLSPTEWGTDKRPVFLDNAAGGGYNKENENCVFLGQAPRTVKEYLKLDTALDKRGLDVLWLDVNCEKPDDYWTPHGGVCKTKAKEDEGYGKGKYGDGGGGSADEEDALKKLIKYVTVGSGNFVYAEKNTYMLLLLKDLYGKQMSEKDKKKVCALYKSEYVKTKDEPKNAQEYLDKLLEKTKTSYSDSSDHMFCKFTGVLGACGESCWKNGKPSCSEGYEYFNGNCYKAFTNADKVVKYSEAEKRCKSEDAELVSIHNELERQFVNVLLLNEAKKNEYNSKKPGLAFYWSGMKLEWEEKKLVKASWTDGKPMDYLNPMEWGTEKRPVFLDNAGGGGYNKENENCMFLGQWPRDAKDYMKLDSALEKHGLDVLWLDVNCEKPEDYWGPRGAVCQKKPKADECYGYGDGGGSVEDEEVKKLVTYVTVGSGTFLYTEKYTYMLLQLKGKYGKEMSEEDRKKVCAYYKAEYVKGKDEPKKTQEYVDKVLEKEKTSYSDSTDHMLCKFTGVLGACGSNCKKGY